MVKAQRIAFVFPGQGSQVVGMGKAWAELSQAARETFEEAEAVLGIQLRRLCWEGPEAELQLTANTQPAILTVSVAIFRALSERGWTAGAAAGHSLGEYSALVATDALRFADALRLVRRRGQLMQDAVPVGEGAMAAVLGVSARVVEEVAADAAEDQVCAVANFNAPEQAVLAGHREAVERATAIAQERGAKKVVMLPVSAPFHTALMRSARRGLEPLLRATAFQDPRIPVVCNVDATPVTTGEAAREALIRQVDGSVRWVESVSLMAEDLGTEVFVEVGPGSTLSALIRRIIRGGKTAALAEPAGLDRLAELGPLEA